MHWSLTYFAYQTIRLFEYFEYLVESLSLLRIYCIIGPCSEGRISMD